MASNATVVGIRITRARPLLTYRYLCVQDLAEAFGVTGRRVSQVGIGDQQGVCRKFRFEGGGQPGLGQDPADHNEIQGLPSTVTRH